MTPADSIEQLKNLPPSTIAAAVAILVVLVIGLRLLFKKPPAHLIAFSGEAGSVLVSRKALQELIKQICLNDDWVENVAPTIKIQDGKVNTHAKLRLRSPEDLKKNCERIQNDITTLLKKSLSFDQIGTIEIVVSSFGNNPQETAVKKESSLEVPTKPSLDIDTETDEEKQRHQD